MAFLRPGKRVCIIEFQGIVGRGIRADTHLPLLERVRKSARFGAVVLVIDSPGGSAATAEELYLAVKKVAEKKPVVAYIRGIGASGALYISVAAHKTVSLRNALIGSIGVVTARPIFEELIKRIGIDMSVQKSGANKDMYQPWRHPTAEETEKMQALLDDVYERFISDLARERGIDPATVREMATGEVFTAKKAHELGLIDDFGDLDTALDLAAEMAGIKRREAYLRPRRRFFPMVRAGFGREAVEAVVDEIEAGLIGRVWL